MLNVECGVWNYLMWNVECGMWSVECGMVTASRNEELFNVECGVLSVEW